MAFPSYQSWIGVDLDGTLAAWPAYPDGSHIGPPIPLMLARVRRWLRQGREVRIVTARATSPEALPAIEAWLAKHGLAELAVTCSKDFGMIELWDDRVVRVEQNTGRQLSASWLDEDESIT